MNGLPVAIVGLGEFGLRYARALDAVPGLRLAWAIDQSEANRDRIDSLGLAAHVGENIEAALADKSVAAVFVVTPEASHRDLAIAALEAGKHVVVEKPMATSLDDGKAMIDAATKTGMMLLPAMLLRFDYRYAQLPERLGEIGPVRTAYAYRNFDRSLFEHYSRTHSFIENAIHDIDLLMWLIGGQVTNAHGFTRNTLGRENPDVNWGVLEFDGGALATLQTSWLYPAQEHRNLQWNSGLQLMCDGGVLEVRNDGQGFTANTEADGLLLLDQTGWADLHGEPRGAFGAMIRHFGVFLRGEASWAGATASEALASMAVARRLIEDAEDRPMSAS